VPRSLVPSRFLAGVALYIAACMMALLQPGYAAAGTQPACAFVSDPNLIAIVVQVQSLTPEECSAPAFAQIASTYGLSPMYYGRGLPARFGSPDCQFLSNDGTVQLSFYDTALTRFSHVVTQAACSSGPPTGFFIAGGN